MVTLPTKISVKIFDYIVRRWWLVILCIPFALLIATTVGAIVVPILAIVVIGKIFYDFTMSMLIGTRNYFNRE